MLLEFQCGKVRNQTWPGFYRLWPCVWISNDLPDGNDIY
jgi:hypothetical protein